MMKLVVLSCMLAAASASSLLAPYASLAYTAPLAYSAAVWAPNNYRGPLSLAPGQPANIIAADGRPLDTLEVNLDRSAHILSKAFNGHLLKKRSVVSPLVAPFAYSALLQPYNYRGPLSLAPGQPANVLGADGRPLDTLEVNLDRSAHFVSKALEGNIHLLKKRSVVSPLITPVASRIAIAPAPLIAHAAPLTFASTGIAPIAHVSTYAAPYSTYW